MTAVAAAEVQERENRVESPVRQRSREEMITANLPLVNFVLSRMSDVTGYAALDREDAFAHGVEGLIQAVDNFDPSRGTSFASYAILRIRGSILDALRRLDIMPRAVRKASREVEAANLELANELGRWPTLLELSQRTGMSPEDLRRSLHQSGTGLSSLEKLMGSDSDSGGWEAEDTAEFADPALATEREVELSLLGDALGLLPARDRQIIELRYRQAKSFLEIARRLNLSESRVCQLHRRAVSRLRLRICSQLAAA